MYWGNKFKSKPLITDSYYFKEVKQGVICKYVNKNCEDIPYPQLSKGRILCFLKGPGMTGHLPTLPFEPSEHMAPTEGSCIQEECRHFRRFHLLDGSPRGTTWQAGEELKGKDRSQRVWARVQGTTLSGFHLRSMMAAKIFLFYTLGSQLRFCLKREASMLMANKITSKLLKTTRFKDTHFKNK